MSKSDTTTNISETPPQNKADENDYFLDKNTDTTIKQNEALYERPFCLHSEKPFVSKWSILYPGEQIELPLSPGSIKSYDFIVDWGDGKVEEVKEYGMYGNKSHVYRNPGIYKVTVTGKVGALFNPVNNLSIKNLIEVVNLGDLGYVSLEQAFQEAHNLKSFKGGCTDQVGSMREMFKNAKSLEFANFSSFNTEKVTTMAGMFIGNLKLVSLDLSTFDTSEVSSMYDMFNSMESLSELNVSSFDTSNVNSMTGMFSGLKSLKSLDLTHFNTQNVRRMDKMFSKSSKLEFLDLESFNTSQVQTMSNMFSETLSLRGIYLLNFDTSNVKDMDKLFYKAASIEYLDLNHFLVKQIPITNFTSIFQGTENLKYLKIDSWKMEKSNFFPYESFDLIH
ncbi:MAG: BspA family leucine-rich repeat surface protein [Halobacteriovoraceae bacterium]|nr:BspA family leucine-rich repeat surface protein [Halobacteriovoraceae bacterium]